MDGVKSLQDTKRYFGVIHGSAHIACLCFIQPISHFYLSLFFYSEGTRETPSHRFSDFKFKTYSPVAFRLVLFYEFNTEPTS